MGKNLEKEIIKDSEKYKKIVLKVECLDETQLKELSINHIINLYKEIDTILEELSFLNEAYKISSPPLNKKYINLQEQLQKVGLNVTETQQNTYEKLIGNKNE